MTNSTIDPKLTVKLGDEDVNLLMSFGLLNRLTALCDLAHPVENVMFDEEMRTKVLRLVLQKRGEFGKYPKEVAEKLDIDELAISIEDVTRLFRWVLEHVSDFFLRAAESVMEVQKANESRQTSLTPSPDGSTA